VRGSKKDDEEELAWPLVSGVISGLASGVGPPGCGASASIVGMARLGPDWRADACVWAGAFRDEMALGPAGMRTPSATWAAPSTITATLVPIRRALPYRRRMLRPRGAALVLLSIWKAASSESGGETSIAAGVAAVALDAALALLLAGLGVTATVSVTIRAAFRAAAIAADLPPASAVC